MLVKNEISYESKGLFKRLNHMTYDIFYELMSLEELNLNDSNKAKIKALYIRSEKSDTKSDAFDCIDALITEKNYEDFKKTLSLDDIKMNDMMKDNIKKLYCQTDALALQGSIKEAKKSWQLLMIVIKKYKPSFISLPLNEFDGGIPQFPVFIINDFTWLVDQYFLKKDFTKVELKFIDALYDEARLYYEIGHFDKGDDVWKEIQDIINQRRRK